MTEHSAITQRVGFTGARLRISRLKPETSLTRTLERVCEISAHTLGVARVGIWLLEDDNRRIRCAAQYIGGVVAPKLEVIELADKPRYTEAIVSNRFLSAPDVQADSRTNELTDSYLRPLSIVSLLDAALYREGRVIGIVCHESCGVRREWTTDERQFAATVADLAAYAIEAHARSDAERQAMALQISMLERDRLEIIGRFATGVAHDMNNLIAAAQLNLDILKSGASSAVQADAAKELVIALGHAQGLSKQLMAFQKASGQAMLIGAAELRTQLEPLLATFIKAPVVVRYSVSHDATFFAIPEQLVQVVVNLVTNARDAMKDGGVVLVRCRPSEDEAGFTQLDIVDTGDGISPEHAVQLFQPFFTTKGKDGTGLGLSLVHFIVGQHHGTVAIHSTPGEGTTVSIRWPADAAHAAKAGA
jgi:signal transduction histidine kinase